MRHAYATDRLLLAVIGPDDAGLVLDYLARNRSFHQPWFPQRDDAVFTVKNQRNVLRRELADFEAGRSLPLWLFRKDQPGQIIGRFILSTIVRGAFQSAILSYHIDREAQGQGLASEAGQAIVELGFNVFGLHRIEANILPANDRSIALVQRLGFELEGLSRRYLQIEGQWADHLHFVRLADGPLYQNPNEPVLQTDRVLIRPIAWQDLGTVVDYQIRNQDHLAAFSPQWTQAVPADLRSHFCDLLLAAQMGQLFEFGIFLPDRPDRLIGLLQVRNLQHLPYSSCELGFSLDQALVGQGLVFEALTLLLDFLFGTLGLHRIAAHCLESNQRSRSLLERLGFTAGGRDSKAVLIDGQWQDLLVWHRLNDSFAGC